MVRSSAEGARPDRITSLSIWNARASAIGADAIVSALSEYAKYPVVGTGARNRIVGKLRGLGVFVDEQEGAPAPRRRRH